MFRFLKLRSTKVIIGGISSCFTIYKYQGQKIILNYARCIHNESLFKFLPNNILTTDFYEKLLKINPKYIKNLSNYVLENHELRNLNIDDLKNLLNIDFHKFEKIYDKINPVLSKAEQIELFKYFGKYDNNSGKLITVEQLYKFFPDLHFIRHTKRCEVHNGFKFKDGLNEDVNDFDPTCTCCAGGLYFTFKESNKWKEFWMRDVTFDKYGIIHIEPGLKAKTKKMYLGKKRQTYDKRTKKS